MPGLFVAENAALTYALRTLVGIGDRVVSAHGRPFGVPRGRDEVSLLAWLVVIHFLPQLAAGIKSVERHAEARVRRHLRHFALLPQV